MENTPKLQKQYDHVLIGYNLSSITFAYELFKRDESFCVIDSRHFGSNSAKYIPSLETLISTRVPFNTPIESKDDLSLTLFGDISLNEGPPMTFDKGDFKSFLGFGEAKVNAMDAVAPYCSATNSQPRLQSEDFWNKILECTQNNIFLDQQITDIEYSEDGINQIMLNAKTPLRGKKFYFFGQFPFLFEKLGSEMKKQASQFAKATWYSSVNLVIHHKSEPAKAIVDQLYLLMGSKAQPCLGQFSKIKGHWVSRWESFFLSELAADSETTGVALKEIKKQIKRAFPVESAQTDPEHILLHDHVFSELEKTGIKNGKLSHFNNLFIYSPLFNNKLGWAHEILTGLQATSDLESSSEKNREVPAIEVAAPGSPC